MINLLPPDVKQSFNYARRNAYLMHWISSVFIGVVGVIAIVVAGQIYLQNSINSFEGFVNSGNQALEEQKLNETQAKVQDLTSSLKLVVQVLQKEILFSKLLTQTGAALPNGSVLTNLSINNTKGGLDLQSAAKDYQTATQVQVNLQDPKNKIFEKADIVNIQCQSAESSNENDISKTYPCTIQLRALFAKNNSFTFISPTGSKP